MTILLTPKSVEEVGRHILVMRYNQEAIAQRKAQLGHFQQTLNAGGSAIAPFPHLAITPASSSVAEVSNLRRYRVLEGLPGPIHNFVCNVQWPEGVTYKKVILYCTDALEALLTALRGVKLSASGHTDYVQYSRISFFSGLSSCYEALECIDLSQYKQCRNGSTYVLPIGTLRSLLPCPSHLMLLLIVSGKCISYEDKAPHWLIMSLVETDDPTLIIVNAR